MIVYVWCILCIYYCAIQYSTRSHIQQIPTVSLCSFAILVTVQFNWSMAPHPSFIRKMIYFLYTTLQAATKSNIFFLFWFDLLTHECDAWCEMKHGKRGTRRSDGRGQKCSPAVGLIYGELKWSHATHFWIYLIFLKLIAPCKVNLALHF